MLFEDYCSIISTVIFNIVNMPQIYRIIKLDESESISMSSQLLLLTSFLFYSWFSYKKNLLVQLYGTFLQMFFLLVILFYKIKHNIRRRKSNNNILPIIEK